MKKDNTDSFVHKALETIGALAIVVLFFLLVFWVQNGKDKPKESKLQSVSDTYSVSEVMEQYDRLEVSEYCYDYVFDNLSTNEILNRIVEKDSYLLIEYINDREVVYDYLDGQDYEDSIYFFDENFPNWAKGSVVYAYLVNNPADAEEILEYLSEDLG